MSELLKVIASLSVSGSVLILLLLLLKPLVRGRVSKRWQYYIWLLVAARLLLPVGPAGSPAGNAVQEADSAARSMMAVTLDRTPAASPSDSLETPPREPAPEQTALQRAGEAAWDHLWVIWMTGALALLIRKITAYQSFSRYVKAGWETVDDPALLDRVAEVGAELGVKRPVELYVNPLAPSPMLLGVWKPCIVLPDAGLPEEDLRFVLLHELTHCRRRDLLYKWLMQLTACVHWFNPLVHWMVREAGRMGELACDEAVLRKLDENGRRAYGDTLLRTTAAGGSYKAALPSATLGESGELLKERLETIMKFRKPTKLAAVLAAILAVTLSVTALAAGAYTGVPAMKTEGMFWEDILPKTKERKFSMESFYQEPYMFTIGWNALEQDDFIPVALPDGSTMKVWCTSACLWWMEQDPGSKKALSEVVVKLWEEHKGSGFPVTSPMLFFYQNVGNYTSAELMERYYYVDVNLSAFKTAFAGLSSPDKLSWLLKIYDDGKISYFSAAVDSLKVDSDTVKALAERFYKDGSISFFSVLMDRMSEETMKAWAERANEKNNFRASLLENLGNDDEWEKLKSELDKQQADEYAKLGVTVEGKNRYYQGKLVNIFLDHRTDSSFYVLDMNPKGSINIKIVHDKDGNRTGVAYLTQEEISELFGDDFEDDSWDDDWDDDWVWDNPEDGKYIVDREIDSIKDGEFIWLGTFEMKRGDRIYYDVSAESGKNLIVGFAKPNDKKPITTYTTVSVNRRDGDLEIYSGPLEWGVADGKYSLFVHTAPGCGEVKDVSAHVRVLAAD